MNLKLFCTLIFSIFLFSACSAKYDNVDLNKKDYSSDEVKKMAEEIISISPKIDKKEAYAVSYDAITYSKVLANKYELTSPPLFHNFLVNIHVKERGLCYHFARDLLAYLQTRNYKTFDFKRVVADKKGYFEHNAVLLTVKGLDLQESIVLDAWRNSGKLYESKLKDDKDYKWELLK